MNRVGGVTSFAMLVLSLKIKIMIYVYVTLMLTKRFALLSISRTSRMDLFSREANRSHRSCFPFLNGVKI